jgi:hypothetical protein
MNLIPIQNNKPIQLLFLYSKPSALSTTSGSELLFILCSLHSYSMTDIPSAQILQTNINFTKSPLSQH